ncbi:amidohydrolase family protein [Maribacter chungangensis]|uniref:Amidohydrolase family protein n=1 Tax=Maribacter chungangensis TaxID=1069117 RepID=A0ABW3B2N3_9FLAO
MCFVFASLVVVGCKVDEKVSYDILLKNGNVIDLETGTIAVQNVLITDGKILKLLPPEDLTTVSAMQTIDATDQFILPGFWDNHVHFRGGDSVIEANKDFLTLFMANGITTVRDAGGDLTTSVMEWKASIASGALLGPTIYTSGPKIDGPNSTWAGSLEVSDITDIEIALDSLESIPVDFIKLYDSRITGEHYLNTLKAAEKRNLISSGHMPFTVTLDETIDAGVDAVEHLYYIMKGCSANEKEITERLAKKEIGFWDAMPLLMESYADTTAQKTFTKLKTNAIYVVPTLHIGEILSYLDEVNHENDPYLSFMDDGIVATYNGRVQRALNASEQQTKDRKALQRFFGELAKSLHDSGVGLLAGSDSGAFNSYTYPGISLHEELAQMVRLGISPLEALKTSAYNGARFLKKDSDYGNIAAGKIADIVILKGNPLQDISQTQNISMVIKQGKAWEQKVLNDKLEALRNNTK